MPSNTVKSFAEKSGKSISEVEKAWNKAKAMTHKEYPNLSEDNDRFWAIVTKITKNLIGLKESTENSEEILSEALTKDNFVNKSRSKIKPNSDVEKLINELLDGLDQKFLKTASYISVEDLGENQSVHIEFNSAPTGSTGVDFHNAKVRILLAIDGFDKEGNVKPGRLSLRTFLFSVRNGGNIKKIRAVNRQNNIEKISVVILKWAHQYKEDLVRNEMMKESKFLDLINNELEFLCEQVNTIQEIV